MKGNPRLLLPIVMLLLLAAAPVHGWSGRVSGVADGDTISVLHEGRAVKIRLYGIDSPEKHQAFGQKAKTFTSQLAFGKVVEVDPVTRDRYGRTVAWVHVGGRCLNEEILRAGYAWHFKRYSRDRHLADLELQARAARAWSLGGSGTGCALGVSKGPQRQTAQPADSLRISLTDSDDVGC